MATMIVPPAYDPHTATGDYLDVVGEALFLIKRDGRTDAEYRKALLDASAALGPPDVFFYPGDIFPAKPKPAPSAVCACGIARVECKYHGEGSR